MKLKHFLMIYGAFLANTNVNTAILSRNLITRIVMPVVSEPQMTAKWSGDFGIANTGFSFFLLLPIMT